MIKQAIRRKKTEIKYGFYEKIIHELNNQNYCIAIDEQLQILLLLNNWLSLKKEKEVSLRIFSEAIVAVKNNKNAEDVYRDILEVVEQQTATKNKKISLAELVKEKAEKLGISIDSINEFLLDKTKVKDNNRLLFFSQLQFLQLEDITIIKSKTKNNDKQKWRFFLHEIDLQRVSDGYKKANNIEEIIAQKLKNDIATIETFEDVILAMENSLQFKKFDFIVMIFEAVIRGNIAITLKQFATFTAFYFNQIKRHCTIENIQEYYKNIFNYFIAQYQNHWILLDNTAVIFTLNYLIQTNKEDALMVLWFDFLAHKILKNENHFSEKGIAFSILTSQDEVKITDKYLSVLDNIKPYEMIDFLRGVFYIDKHTIQNKFFVRKINDWLLQLSEEEFFQQVFLLRTIFSQLDESERKLFYT